MRSCSVNPIRNAGETRLMDNKNNFEDIDEALHSESKGTSYKNYIEDRERSNTSLERDIINISEIVDKNKLTKKMILENISFDTTQHDIYKPDYSSCDNIQIGKENSEISKELELPIDLFEDSVIGVIDYKPKTSVSPIRIKRKVKVKSKLERDFASHHTSMLSRNLSQHTWEKENVSSLRKRRQPQTKLFISTKKKKKLKFAKKKKHPYTYFEKKQTIDAAVDQNAQRKLYFDNYFIKNDRIKSNDRMILASSTKQATATIHTPLHEASTIESGRIRSSQLRNDLHFRSTMSIHDTEVSNITQKKRNTQIPTTPVGDNTRSTFNFRRIVHSYSSKGVKRNFVNAIPWSSNIKQLPRHSNRYLKTNSNKMIAQAYKSIPKEALMSKRTLSKRKIGQKRSKLPLPHRPILPEDQTICLMLKHLRSTSDQKLPKVNSQAGFRTASNFINSRKIERKVSN
jgi:hypothetical protein